MLFNFIMLLYLYKARMCYRRIMWRFILEMSFILIIILLLYLQGEDVLSEDNGELAFGK